MRKGIIDYIETYGWMIIVVIIVAGALYALGISDPNTYIVEDNSEWSNCSAYFFPAKFNHVAVMDIASEVQHFHDDTEFIDNLRESDVWVYCIDSTQWTVGTKCGAFNNMGVFHWTYVPCNLGEGHGV